MARFANNMYIPAIMKSIHNINHRFEIQETGKFSPAVISFHSYSRNAGSMSNKITASAWALEYHSKYAGRIFLKTLSNSIDREKQTVHLYAPGCIYWEDFRDADYPIQETYFYFTGAEACGLGSFISPNFKFARFKDPDNLVGNLFSAAMASCSNMSEDPFWSVQGCLMRMIHHLLHSRSIGANDYLISASAQKVGTTEFSYVVQEYLRRNIGRNVTLSEIASYMKTSESLLSHKFKEEVGVSPISRHAELRIEFAKSLILKGEKLKSVAEMTGYVDEYHLSRVFKSITGLSPSNFRKMAGSG